MRLASATGPSVPRALLSGDAKADMLGWFATWRSVDAIGQRGTEAQANESPTTFDRKHDFRSPTSELFPITATRKAQPQRTHETHARLTPPLTALVTAILALVALPPLPTSIATTSSIHRCR